MSSLHPPIKSKSSLLSINKPSDIFLVKWRVHQNDELQKVTKNRIRSKLIWTNEWKYTSSRNELSMSADEMEFDECWDKIFTKENGKINVICQSAHYDESGWIFFLWHGALSSKKRAWIYDKYFYS